MIEKIARWDIYAFNSGEGSFLLEVVCQPATGAGNSEEAEVALALLRKSLAVGEVGAESETGNSEPPLRFTLEIGTRSLEIRLDESAQARIGRAAVDVKLTALPYRMFKIADVGFRYPREFRYRVDGADPEFGIRKTWRFEGRHMDLKLVEYEKQDPESLLREIVWADSQFRQTVTLATKTRTLEGLRDDFILRADHYAFRGKDATFVLIVEVPKSEDARKETDVVLRYLRDSLALP